MRNGGAVMGAVVLGLLLSSGGEAGNTGTQGPIERPASDVDVEDFAWLAGYWRGEGLGGVCEEIWSEPLAGSMIGLFRLVRNRVCAEGQALHAGLRGLGGQGRGDSVSPR